MVYAFSLNTYKNANLDQWLGLFVPLKTQPYLKPVQNVNKKIRFLEKPENNNSQSNGKGENVNAKADFGPAPSADMEDAKTQDDGIDDHMDNPVIKAEAADGLQVKMIKNWSTLPIH